MSSDILLHKDHIEVVGQLRLKVPASAPLPKLLLRNEGPILEEVDVVEELRSLRETVNDLTILLLQLTDADWYEFKK